ncbi:MAG: alkaline phosphatase family protein [Acidobacteriota bacterium]
MRKRLLVFLLTALAPGALAGALAAGLIFFLNPDLPLDPEVFVRAVAVYGALLGLFGAVVLWPLAWRRPESGRRWLPWAIAVILAAAALLYGAHASSFAYYLPAAINRRLLRTAVCLAVAALLWFYTALLHTLQARPYGGRSRVGLLLLTIAALAVMVERRVSYHPSAAPFARLSVETPRPVRLCVFGVEAATLDAVLPLAEQGQLPFLADLLQRGSYSRLKTLEPTWRIPVWMTLSTGKYPFKHGLLAPRMEAVDFLVPGGRLRLIPQWIGFGSWGTLWHPSAASDSSVRKAMSLWEILSRHGASTGVVAWPGSAPLPEGMHFAVSDRFFGVGGQGENDVRPASAAQALVALRPPQEEFARALAGRFGARPDSALLTAAAADRWRESATLQLLGEHAGSVQTLWLHLRGLGAVSARLFGGYSAARLEGSQASSDQRAAQELTAYYGYVDSLMSEVVSRAGPFDFIAVVSAHGVSARSGWRRALATFTSSPTSTGQWDDAPDGLFILSGAGLQPGNLATDAHVADVMPTLLYAMGMPVGDDLDGRVLTGAFDSAFLARQALSFVPTYEVAPSP